MPAEAETTGGEEESGAPGETGAGPTSSNPDPSTTGVDPSETDGFTGGGDPPGTDESTGGTGGEDHCDPGPMNGDELEIEGIIDVSSAVSGVVRLTGDVQIAEDAIVTVAPGTIVYGGCHEVEVFGQLHVQGSADDPVTINGTLIVPRGGEGEADPSRCVIDIAFADIRGGAVTPPTGDAQNGIVSLTDSTITDASETSCLWYPHGDCTIARNIFHDGTMDARDNYWGTENLAEIRDRIIDRVDDLALQAIPFEPVLTAPHAQPPELD